MYNNSKTVRYFTSLEKIFLFSLEKRKKAILVEFDVQ